MNWRTSSYSPSSACVEVSRPEWRQSLFPGGKVLVRDAKNLRGRMLAFTPAAWAEFLVEVQGARPSKGNSCCQCGTPVPGDELYCNRCGPR